MTMPRRSGFAPARSAPAGRAVVPYVCAVAWLAACTPDLAVPATAHVGCRSDADCPSGFLCATSLGRCVQLVGRDTVPPALDGDAAVDPPRGRAGTAFRVRFMVSEPLSEPPEVVARTGDGAASRTAAFAQESGDGTSFAYAWTAKDTDPEGTWTAGIAMLDAGGNRAAAPGGTFVLDRTPPGIVPGSGRAEPQVAAAGAHVAVEFAVADADTTPVEVRVGANSAAFLSQEGARCSYEYVVAQDDPDGTATATAHLKDSAGNEADVDVASFEVDRTAPTVAQAPTLPARPLHAGEAVALVIGFSEAVGDAPAPAAPLAVRMESGSASVTLARTSLGSGQWSAQWSFLHVVEEADRGRWTLWLRNAADRAGNAIAAQRLGELDVDTVPPGMSAGPVLQRSGWFAAGDTVRVMFTPDEEAQAWVSLSVAGISVEMTPEEGADGYARVYSHAVAADDPQGEAEVVVRLSDRALNAGGPWRVAGLALDTVAPTVGDVQVAPAIMVAARTNLVVTAFADDVLASARVESQPALSFPAPVLSGRQALWNYLVSPADESRDYLLTVRVVDRAGNESGPADAIVRFDTRPPQALHVAMEGSPARDGTLLRVRFEASENLLGTPEVTMGDAPMDLDSATDRRYAFSHRAAEAEGSGVRDVAVRMRDPAGNETETLLGRATYDFDRPVVAPADVHVAPASPVGIGAVLSIAATADEALDSARVEATPSLDPGDAIISGRTARWARSVSGADAPGKRTFTIRVSDLAGNESDSITAEAVLDTVPPAISGGVVSGSPARAGTTVRVEFDVSEDVAAPRAILGSAPMQPDAAATSGRHFAFVRVAAPEDGDGTRDATVEVADAAGNAGRARLGSVVFDFTPPRLRASDVAVWPANPVGLGASLSVSVGSDEPLSRAGLAAMPVLDFGAPIVSLDGASWSHSVAASDASGSYELHVAIKDLAGNESSLTLATPIVLDTVRPQVTGAVVRGSPARAGSLISVEFDVSEDLPSPPSVTVGATAMTLDSAHSTARHYVFAHTAAASEVSGVKPVQISVADAAGNVTVAAPGQVVCDFEAPIMSAVAVTPDSPVGLGANLVITATTDEALGPEAALETTPSLPFGAAVISGRSAIWSHVLAGSDLSGTLSVDRLVVHDLAGNETTIARPSAAVLDTAAPALLQGYSVEGSPARDGSPIRATFDVSEAPAGVPSVRIGTVPMTPNTELSTETHFVFDQTAAAAEGDGIKEVRASLVDAAGNGLSTMLGTVVYDFTPPGESPAGNGIRASTTLAGIGTLLRITADFDEPIQTATLDAGEGPSFGAAIVAGRQVVWTRLVAAGDPQGPFGATVRVTDAADNAYERTVATLAAVDSAPPVFVPGATVTPDLPAARGTPIAARFSTGEALPVPPAVRVGGTAMTLSSESTSTSFVYTHTRGFRRRCLQSAPGGRHDCRRGRQLGDDGARPGLVRLHSARRIACGIGHFRVAGGCRHRLGSGGFRRLRRGRRHGDSRRVQRHGLRRSHDFGLARGLEPCRRARRSGRTLRRNGDRDGPGGKRILAHGRVRRERRQRPAGDAASARIPLRSAQTEHDLLGLRRRGGAACLPSDGHGGRRRHDSRFGPDAAERRSRREPPILVHDAAGGFRRGPAGHRGASRRGRQRDDERAGAGDVRLHAPGHQGLGHAGAHGQGENADGARERCRTARARDRDAFDRVALGIERVLVRRARRRGQHRELVARRDRLRPRGFQPPAGHRIGLGSGRQLRERVQRARRLDRPDAARGDRLDARAGTPHARGDGERHLQLERESFLGACVHHRRLLRDRDGKRHELVAESCRLDYRHRGGLGRAGDLGGSRGEHERGHAGRRDVRLHATGRLFGDRGLRACLGQPACRRGAGQTGHADRHHDDGERNARNEPRPCTDAPVRIGEDRRQPGGRLRRGGRGDLPGHRANEPLVRRRMHFHREMEGRRRQPSRRRGLLVAGSQGEDVHARALRRPLDRGVPAVALGRALGGESRHRFPGAGRPVFRALPARSPCGPGHPPGQHVHDDRRSADARAHLGRHGQDDSPRHRSGECGRLLAAPAARRHGRPPRLRVGRRRRGQRVRRLPRPQRRMGGDAEPARVRLQPAFRSGERPRRDLARARRPDDGAVDRR